jgi:hypothetical protein
MSETRDEPPDRIGFVAVGVSRVFTLLGLVALVSHEYRSSGGVPMARLARVVWRRVTHLCSASFVSLPVRGVIQVGSCVMTYYGDGSSVVRSLQVKVFKAGRGPNWVADFHIWRCGHGGRVVAEVARSAMFSRVCQPPPLRLFLAEIEQLET